MNVEDKLAPVADCDCPVGGDVTTEFSGTVVNGTDPQVVTCGDLANEIGGGFANYTLHNFISENGVASFSLTFTMHTVGCNTVAAVYEGFDPDAPCENQVAFGAAGGVIPVTNSSTWFIPVGDFYRSGDSNM